MSNVGPVIELIRTDNTNKQSTFLKSYARNVASQCGEDGILEKIFEIIGRKSGWCVEFGAWDGKYLSNTYNLMQKGWSGVFIEGNEARFQELRNTYSNNAHAHTINGRVDFDPKRNSLEYFLSKTPIPRQFDLLSIDIDGNDWHVWSSIQKYRPRVVVVEFNPSIPNDVVFIQERNFSINQGCSLAALVRLGRDKNYELVSATDFNAVFVVNEEFSKFGIKDNCVNAMYNDMYTARIFHGYDGRIFTVDLKLIWLNRPIPYDALQAIPLQEQVYGDSLGRVDK